jgi:predicted CXXCH cytochrome family protein
VMQCANCHMNPHQPLASIPAPAELEGQCRTCHAGVAASLTEKPSLHTELECSSCHSEQHGRIPQCSECHDAPHGKAEAVMQCANCHMNPHQPLASIPVPAKLENQCRICHAQVAAVLKGKPSKHTEQECSSCHSEKHGRIPQCAECHESHSPAVQMSTADCLVCHPVHAPLQIAYPKNENKEVCGGCHTEAYDLLAANKTRHANLTCAFCHPSHGQVMACQDCHGLPHSTQIHTKYKVCGTCHSIAHDLQK